jgi:ribosomal protein L23
MGRFSGRTENRLKAIVTLKAGQKIDQLEGLS